MISATRIASAAINANANGIVGFLNRSDRIVCQWLREALKLAGDEAPAMETEQIAPVSTERRETDNYF